MVLFVKETTQQEQTPNLEDCLKLLKGERDEQRLAGLLLVTKFCKADDNSSLRRVYDAVGSRFLDRLLRTGTFSLFASAFSFVDFVFITDPIFFYQIGMGRGTIACVGDNNRDAYLRLSVTVLAAFCRVPEIASMEDMLLKVPLILEVMSTQYVVFLLSPHHFTCATF